MAQQSVAGLWSALTGGGTSEPFRMSPSSQFFVSSIVTSIAGTTPSLQAFLDVLDVTGAWIQVAALTVQSATGTQYAAVTPASTATNLTNTGRLRWTLSGTGNPVIGAAIAVLSA